MIYRIYKSGCVGVIIFVLAVVAGTLFIINGGFH
jgi:hypothetical protein